MKSMALLLCAIVLGCASSPSAEQTSPAVKLTQQSKVQSVQFGLVGGLPVDYDLEVKNPFDHPVTLTSVEIETVGLSGAYELKRVRHSFSIVIAPHSSEVVPIRAWVQTLQETDRGDVKAPVTVRGTVRFDSPSGVMKTAFATRTQ